MKIFPKILICFFLLANCANVSNAQMSSGILKTSEGFLAVINSDSLWFTIQLDDSRFKEPQFIEASRLEVISHVLYVQIFSKSDIATKKGINPLISLMNWETDFIRNSENAPKKRSDFIFDSLGANSKIADVSKNAWYYSVDVDKNDNLLICYSHPLSNYITKFNTAGDTVAAYNFPKFCSPQKVIVDRNNDIWVIL